jgi:hypothetical protein
MGTKAQHLTSREMREGWGPRQLTSREMREAWEPRHNIWFLEKWGRDWNQGTTFDFLRNEGGMGTKAQHLTSREMRETWEPRHNIWLLEKWGRHGNQGTTFDFYLKSMKSWEGWKHTTFCRGHNMSKIHKFWRWQCYI